MLLNTDENFTRFIGGDGERERERGSMAGGGEDTTVVGDTREQSSDID